MKRILTLILVLVMSLSLVACGNTDNNTNDNNTNDNVVEDNNQNETPDTPDEPVEDEPVEDEPAEDEPAEELTALDVLNAAFEKFPEEEQGAFLGGDYDNMNYDVKGPQVFNHENAEYMAALLIANADASAMVDGAASMFHMMNYNNFTCGSFHISDAADVDAFVASMKDSIMNNMWMCGFPEVLVITQIGENNVVVNFGLTDMVNNMKYRLVDAFPEAVVLVEEPIL